MAAAGCAEGDVNSLAHILVFALRLCRQQRSGDVGQQASMLSAGRLDFRSGTNAIRNLVTVCIEFIWNIRKRLLLVGGLESTPYVSNAQEL